MKYAGIGSRETPLHILDCMQWLGACFAQQGFILRSGRARRGADIAFETAARAAGGICEIFPLSNYAPQTWFNHAKMFHPAWSKCSDVAKALHARNSAIMLGADLNDPVEFVCCWTIDGEATGGTGQALRIAEHFEIPVFNLFHDPSAETLFKWLDGER